ncbi:MAG TPA: membrane dipeptidase [Bryobacteraceae bacterium]|nr:membrane dipeptidase [Bryobacteraceae bacterium]
MTRRHLFASAAATIAAPMVNLGRCQLFGATGATYSTRVVDLVSRSLVIDMLGLLTMDWPKLARWHSDPSSFRAEDFDQVRRARIDVLHPAVELGAEDAFEGTCKWLSSWEGFVQQNPTRFRVVRTCRDLVSAKDSWRVGILFGMQNSEHFRSAADVPFFYARGQRISQLTYNASNRLGSGCGEPGGDGLSAFGAEIVQAMNSCGMAIDVSHANERTTLEAIEASSKPLLVTHSNCRALVRHPRCKSDAVIRAMARKGGVMGITGVGAFLSSRRKASIEDVLNHFDHVARLVGIEHLGIGSDAGVDEGRPLPHLEVQGLRQSRRVFDLTAGFVRRGYSNAAIEAILGRNFQSALNKIIGA